MEAVIRKTMCEIPPITAVEPVYPTPDASESVWVECELVWDDEREMFTNEDSDPDWQLDEHAYQDSTYYVRDSQFDTVDEAIREALRGHCTIDGMTQKRLPGISHKYSN